MPEPGNYPFNCWWVAAFSDEVGRDLLGRWLLDTPVLLYRRENGTVAAIEDRCPHRGAPLSLGCLKGDTVQCGYHGFTFDSEGECIQVPSLKAALPAARIRSFAIMEQAPFVWIWLGDPDRIDSVAPPHQPDWLGTSEFAERHGRIDIAANYMLLKENVLDLTHFGYVHASTFKITDWVDPPRLSSDGETAGYHQSFSSSPLPPVFAEPMGMAPGTLYDRENYGSFLTPALQIAAVDLIEPSNRHITGRFRVIHATTPIDATHMHYFWSVARDHGTDDKAMEALSAITKLGFAEDESMIEAIQALRNRDPRGATAPEFSVKMDSAGIQARRIVQKWMDRD
ncbi:aromatic ring-hydroxylating dioxygenase subunit alpha [Novosphingobium sp.]|uniref:aromatic ring-hydroxylating dioxygenase subunit alpha n=1 Tax=Novosphingobium sp. TaxID=1874826 RepID=UPI00260362CF|nr:aromatic ring-hydroxylating dioxygenase subunit alpha [Novosphingobium sp.]